MYQTPMSHLKCEKEEEEMAQERRAVVSNQGGKAHAFEGRVTAFNLSLTCVCSHEKLHKLCVSYKSLVGMFFPVAA